MRTVLFSAVREEGSGRPVNKALKPPFRLMCHKIIIFDWMYL